MTLVSGSLLPEPGWPRRAFAAWRAGDTDVAFPAGTYWLRHHAGARCAGEFFLEVLPRSGYLTLLLNIDFNEVTDLSPRVRDATEQKSFFHARYAGGACISLHRLEDVGGVMTCIRRAHELALG